jgi:hypothetical protein
MQEDKRQRAQKFYRLFQAGFLHAKGEDDAAQKILLDSGRPVWQSVDTTYEKLLIAMTEDLEISILKNIDERRVQSHIVNLYRFYPQAVLLWGHRLPVSFRANEVARRSLTQEQDSYVNEVIETLSRFGFDFQEQSNTVIPNLRIAAESDKGVLKFYYEVTLDRRYVARGIVPSAKVEGTAGQGNTKVVPRPSGEIAQQIAYGIFHIQPKPQEKLYARNR